MARWRSSVLTPDGYVDHDAYEDARTRLRVVADCHCGGVMRPLPPEVVGKIRWYTALCEACQADLPAPNGRTPRVIRARKTTPPPPRRARRQQLHDLVDPRRPGEREAV
jgi:hypothetical protein